MVSSKYFQVSVSFHWRKLPKFNVAGRFIISRSQPPRYFSSLANLSPTWNRDSLFSACALGSCSSSRSIAIRIVELAPRRSAANPDLPRTGAHFDSQCLPKLGIDQEFALPELWAGFYPPRSSVPATPDRPELCRTRKERALVSGWRGLASWTKLDAFTSGTSRNSKGSNLAIRRP